MLVVMKLGANKKFAKVTEQKSIALVESIHEDRDFVKEVDPSAVFLVDNIEDCSRFDEIEEAQLADGLLYYCRKYLDGQFVCVPVTDIIFS